MAKILAVVALALVALVLSAEAQCPANPLPAGEYDFGINVDGRNRTFIVRIPRGVSATKAKALFFHFHGFTNTAEEMIQRTGIFTLAEQEGFIGVVPTGVGLSWNGGSCCAPATTLNIDDVKFAREMVKYISARVCVDSTRVFSSGYSNGGFMSYRLACEASDVFRAIGPVAGALSPEREFPCDQTRPVPTIHFHGTADGTIRYADGEAGFERYRDIQGCTRASSITFQNRTASCETWAVCPSTGYENTFCTIQGQGHAWPGCNGIQGCSGATQDIDATEQMWQFFLRVSANTKRFD